MPISSNTTSTKIASGYSLHIYMYIQFSLPVDTPSYNLITGIKGVNSMHAQQVNVNRHDT